MRILEALVISTVSSIIIILLFNYNCMLTVKIISMVGLGMIIRELIDIICGDEELREYAETLEELRNKVEEVKHKLRVLQRVCEHTKDKDEPNI